MASEVEHPFYVLLRLVIGWDPAIALNRFFPGIVGCRDQYPVAIETAIQLFEITDATLDVLGRIEWSGYPEPLLGFGDQLHQPLSILG